MKLGPRSRQLASLHNEATLGEYVCDVSLANAAVEKSAATAACTSQPRVSETRAKVLVLTFPFGGGHRRVGEIVADLVASEHTRVDVEVIDPLAVMVPRLHLDRVMACVYACVSTILGGRIALWIYTLADRNPRAVVSLARVLFHVPIRRLVLDLEPAFVVTTFSVLSDVVKRLGRVPRVISIVTDAGQVNRLWFASEADHYLVVDRDSLAVSDRLQVPRSRLTVVDLVPRSTHTVADRLGATPLRVLVTGGSECRSRGFVEFAEMAISANLPVELVIVAGKNAKLARRLGRRAGSRDLRILGWCGGMSEMISDADLVVGKAGWLTMTEVFAAGKPYLIIDTWGRQERINAARAEMAGWAKCMPAADAIAKIREYAMDRALLPAEFSADKSRSLAMVRAEMRKTLAEALNELILT